MGILFRDILNQQMSTFPRWKFQSLQLITPNQYYYHYSPSCSECIYTKSHCLVYVYVHLKTYSMGKLIGWINATCSRWTCIILIWGLCFVFALKLCSDRQLSLFGAITHIRLQSLFFCQKKKKASHSTCNMYARGRVLNYKHGGGPKRQQWDLDKWRQFGTTARCWQKHKLSMCALALLQWHPI